MGLTKRLIACLDVKDGRTVKGVQFESLRDMGDPVALAGYYTEAGIDELVFLDISATNERRKTLTGLVKRIAREINIPFTVGGGISSIADVDALLEFGADKVSVNTAAINDQSLIENLSKRFGSQCVVVAIDAKQTADDWLVYKNGGTVATKIPVTSWVKTAQDLGAGEILLTAINNDGTKSGFANELYNSISPYLRIPVIASGGAGNAQHFAEVFTQGNADAALAAGIFHNRMLGVPALKQFLLTQNIPVRI
ncbi:imidazole glycerol phosphate synthase subunit HisF [Taibaiella soli]|uniref:Imidazole glycerol phosphate synthase subunit HisF n=1 Tax=Taibaiella soli TaxID=1649169 RepID=A0A2W2AEM5_9BACT|nr:imidazole glycerol phosphate synthase subunit HisF [Taibaiella soli]PZF73925.1 imidazole glycerol phosphate synthase subunit HisF [Taibaiella soli]